MKKEIILFFAFFVISGCLLFAAPELSGVFDSTVNYTAGAGDAPANSWGIEEYANLRLQIKTGDKATFYSALNLIAQSGNYAEAAADLGAFNSRPGLGQSPMVYGQNYIAGLELERLYFRINGDYFDTEAGLLRMNFGYDQVWGPSDFLNPRNPLLPNARPRGVLGTDFSFYPTDSFKFMLFAAAPKDPLEAEGGGFLPGFSLDQHWDRASLQVLYAFQTPLAASEWGVHRFGLSVKADLVLGFVLDALYTLNPAETGGIEGLSAGTGFDYSFLNGDFYVLFEYLFNGSSSVSAWKTGGDWGNHHYFYGTILYRIYDYCSLTVSALFCADDLSFQPFVTLNYEVSQAFSLNITAHLPLDRKVLSGGRAGELGPLPPQPDGSPGNTGARVIIDAGARLRF